LGFLKVKPLEFIAKFLSSTFPLDPQKVKSVKLRVKACPPTSRNNEQRTKILWRFENRASNIDYLNAMAISISCHPILIDWPIRTSNSRDQEPNLFSS
jgi:hypothetical protein